MVGIAIIRIRPRREAACSAPRQHGTIDAALQKRAIARSRRWHRAWSFVAQQLASALRRTLTLADRDGCGLEARLAFSS
jgi:hypothetical protein